MLRDVVSEAQDNGFRLKVVVDREIAGRLGVSMQTVVDTLSDAFGQRQISTIYGQSNQYRVILEAMPQYQNDPNSLSKLYVPASGIRRNPAIDVADLERRPRSSPRSRAARWCR